MPKVSVIIPAYNAMSYLRETLASALGQTFQDFEVIIVNDGSTDEIESWFSQNITDTRVKLISQTNTGLAGARNTGIAHAQGEYLAFLDADDIWAKSKLEKQVMLLDTNPDVGLVYTWVEYINDQSISTGRVFQHQIEGDVWKQLTEHNIVECGSVAMARCSCFDICGVFDQNLGSYGEDWDMWLRIASVYKFKVVPEILVFYRQHSNNVSKNWDAMEKSFNLIIKKTFRTTEKELFYTQQRCYAYAYLCLAWKPLQSLQKNHKKAAFFRDTATKYYPKIRLSKEYIRLSIAIFLMHYLGDFFYHKFLSFFYYLRRFVVYRMLTSIKAR